MFYGNPSQFVVQLFAVLIVAGFAFVGSYLLLRVINIFTPLRVSLKEEDAGLDITQHGEEAYG